MFTSLYAVNVTSFQVMKCLLSRICSKLCVHRKYNIVYRPGY